MNEETTETRSLPCLKRGASPAPYTKFPYYSVLEQDEEHSRACVQSILPATKPYLYKKRTKKSLGRSKSYLGQSVSLPQIITLAALRDPPSSSPQLSGLRNSRSFSQLDQPKTLYRIGRSKLRNWKTSENDPIRRFNSQEASASGIQTRMDGMNASALTSSSQRIAQTNYYDNGLNLNQTEKALTDEEKLKREHVYKMRYQYGSIDEQVRNQRARSHAYTHTNTVVEESTPRRQFSLYNIGRVNQQRKQVYEAEPITESNQFGEIIEKHEYKLQKELDDVRKRLKVYAQQKSPEKGDISVSSLIRCHVCASPPRSPLSIGETITANYAVYNSYYLYNVSCDFTEQQCDGKCINKLHRVYSQKNIVEYDIEAKMQLKTMLRKAYEAHDRYKVKRTQSIKSTGENIAPAYPARDIHKIYHEPEKDYPYQYNRPPSPFDDFSSYIEREEHKLFATVPENLLYRLREIYTSANDNYGRLREHALSDVLGINYLVYSFVDSKDAFVQDIYFKSSYIMSLISRLEEMKEYQLAMKTPAPTYFEALRLLLAQLRTSVIFSRNNGDLEQAALLFNNVVGRTWVLLVSKEADDFVLKAYIERRVLDCELYTKVLEDIKTREEAKGNTRLAKISRVLRYCEQFQNVVRASRCLEELHMCCTKFESLVLYSEFDLVEDPQ